MAKLRPDMRRVVAPLVATVVFIVIWELAVRFEIVPSFLLPAPSQMAAAFVDDYALLAQHAATTLTEAIVGLAIGILVGFVTAVLMDRFELMYLILDPLLTVSQTVPTVAIAPLLVLWLGYGLTPKIVLIVITTAFPITVSLVSGFKSVDSDVIDLMHTMNASERQIFWHVKLPSALGQFFSGLRISATYAIVGAVIAEWLGGFSGLGVYMTRVRKSFSYDRMFAVIILISALSLALLKGVDLLQRVSMPWRRADERQQ